MKKKMILLSNKILDVLGIIALILCASFVITGLMTGKPSFFGYRVMHVVSASMEPTIMTGDFVIAKDITPDEASIGDIVTYRKRADDGKLTHYTVIHRIVDKKGEQFIFKGDNNDFYDAPVDPSQITYKVVFY